MNIRLAGAADAAILAALDLACTFSAHWDEKGWQGELAQPASRVWCAELNGKIVGFNTDPQFNNAIDALMLLDINNIPEQKIAMLSKELDIDVMSRFGK